MRIFRGIVCIVVDCDVFLKVLAATHVHLFPDLSLGDLRVVDAHSCLFGHEILDYRDSSALARVRGVLFVGETKDADLLVADVIKEASDDTPGEAVLLPIRTLSVKACRCMIGASIPLVNGNH